jgi:hypothetical protein
MIVAYLFRVSTGYVYYLHAKQVPLQSGRVQTVYYFAREVDPAEAVETLPEGMAVQEAPESNLPQLVKA